MEKTSKEESELLVDPSAVAVNGLDHQDNEKELLISSTKAREIKTKLSVINGCISLNNGDVMSHEIIENESDHETEIANDEICNANCYCPANNDKHNNNKLNRTNQYHIFPNVVVNPSEEPSDVDTDEEDYHIRMNNKSDSGQGSSVETSSLRSNPHVLENDYSHNNGTIHRININKNNIDSSFSANSETASVNSSNIHNLGNVLDEIDLNGDENFLPSTRRTSLLRSSPDSQRKISSSSFTDIPLNTPSPPKQVNTFQPSRHLTDGTFNTPLKSPSITDHQPKTSLLKKPSQKSWKIFGKVAVPISKDLSPKSSPSTLRRNKDLTVASSTTGLIFENRPSYLPPKSEKEEQRHREQYEAMLAAARRKELRNHLAEKKRLKERRKVEDQLSNIVKIWKEEIIPHWENCKNTKKVRELWWNGIPSSVRGRVWRLAIGNSLNLTPELFRVHENNAKEKMNRKRYAEPMLPVSHKSESSLVVCKENALGLITLDVSRTFPSLCIFQKGGPYHEPLRNLLGAYTCHRPDVGYVQGMSFLAAMLLLNMDLSDAFIAFANLINRACQMAFFMVDQNMMDAYYRTFDVLMEEQLPRLHTHFRSECLSHDIYLIDWIFTLYSKSLPLDTACRVWDLFCRDGEEFLFRTALGILLMHQDALLEMEFFRLAQYLTKLSNTITADELFHYIEKINFSKQKFQQTLTMFKTIAKSKPIAPT